MPAMPMADSSPPMVVGIRHTSSATSTDDRASRRRHKRAKLGIVATATTEDDGQAGEQDVQRDLVGRLLPLGAFDQRDHAVEEGRARVRGDPHLDPVGEHAGAAGHRRAVAAALADDRRGFAGDRRLRRPRRRLRSLRRRRDQVAGLDQHHVAGLQRRRRRPVRVRACAAAMRLAWVSVRVLAQGVGLRLAAPLGHRLGEVGEQHREPQPERDLEVKARDARLAPPTKDRAGRSRSSATATTSTTNITGFLTMGARVELAERIARSPARSDDRRGSQHRVARRLADARSVIVIFHGSVYLVKSLP